MRKKISVVSFLLAVMMLVSCASSGMSPTVSMFDLSERMLEAHGKPGEMAYASSSDNNAENEFSYISDIDYSKVGSFFVSYAKDGKGNDDEIAVIALKSLEDVLEASDSLKRHIDQRIELYKSYDPGQVPSLENAEIFTYQQYAVLIVSDNSDAVYDAFMSFVKNGEN